MWQSRVEIEGYSVACFDLIAAFEVPYRWTSVKGRAHARFIDAWISNESTKHICMSFTFNGSSAIRHFEGSDAIEIHGTATYAFNHSEFAQLSINLSMWLLVIRIDCVNAADKQATPAIFAHTYSAHMPTNTN